MFAAFFSWLGSIAATIGSSACIVLFADEPKTPKNLIK